MDQHAFRQLIEDIRQQTDLPDLIRSNIELVSCGSVLKGRSLQHEDREPSFVVWPATRTWRDFSGGGSVGGDCFDYVMHRDGISFGEAARHLAARSELPFPGTDPGAADHEAADLAARRELEHVLTAAAAYYHRGLPDEIRQKWYREHYGFTDHTIDDFQLGWANSGLLQHLTEEMQISLDQALATGLIVEVGDTPRDFYQKRLVFPYWRQGRVAYFIARATEMTPNAPWEKAKYKKLLTHSDRHSYVSTLIANDTFYNEDAARGADQLLITEGVTDCISAQQAGVACISPATVSFRGQDLPKLIELTRRAQSITICNDNETSGAGEAGALETAAALHAAGRDVRIATLPLQPGQDKIDINQLVASTGSEALLAVIAEARPFVDYLIARIPVDTPAADLPSQLAPAMAAISVASPVQQDAYLVSLRKRLPLRASTLRGLLRQAGTRVREDGSARAATALKGEIQEAGDHYYLAGPRGEHIALSSFRIVPTARIVLPEGEIIDANIQTDQGRVHHGIRFSREAWNSKRNLLRVLGPIDLQWTGSDDNVQGLLRLVAAQDVPTRQGTTNLGYLETPDGCVWISPGGCLAPAEASAEPTGIVYVSSGATLGDRVRYDEVTLSEVNAAAAVILPQLLALNSPAVILPILGWFFAAPLKPRFIRLLGHFPILVVWGSQGSGKTSLIMEIFWPLLGVISAEPYSATETEFALLKLISATNSVPVFIDEYKPFDMPRFRLNTLHRYMRRLYSGEVEERGRADQTVVSYRLSAPLCLAGETRPIEPALVERILTANPDKNQLMREGAHADAFSRIRTVNPNVLSTEIIRFLLSRNTATDVERARNTTNDLLREREVPHRVRDNLIVMIAGLLCFKEFAHKHGVALPQIDLATAVDGLLEDLLESGGTAVKSGLDYFLEELSAMAVSTAIRPERHYSFHDGLLALHFPSCHAAFTEHCRRADFQGEIPDRKALRRQLVENHRRGGFVKELDALVYMEDGRVRRRAVLIDLEEAKRLLTVDDFPRTDCYTSGARY
jgi:DNA primase catalytic core